VNELIKFLKENGYLSEGADETAIDNQVKAYVETQLTEQTKGLIQNRDSLKEEKLKVQHTLDELKSKYSFVDENELSVEVFSDMKNELENYRAKGGTDEEIEEKLKQNYERGKKQSQDFFSPQLEKLKNDLESMKKLRDEATNSFNSYKAESEIRKAVAETGVKASDIWFKGLMSGAQIEVGEEGRMEISLPYEPGGGNLPLADWVKTFPTTEEARRMMPPKENTGGGAFGGASNTGDGPVSMAETIGKMFNT